VLDQDITSARDGRQAQSKALGSGFSLWMQGVPAQDAWGVDPLPVQFRDADPDRIATPNDQAHEKLFVRWLNGEVMPADVQSAIREPSPAPNVPNALCCVGAGGEGSEDQRTRGNASERATERQRHTVAESVVPEQQQPADAADVGGRLRRPPKEGDTPGGRGTENADNILIDEVKSGVADRVRTYARKVAEARRFGKYLLSRGDCEALERGKKLCECGAALWLRQFFEHPDNPTKLWKAFLCQQAGICDMCGSRASSRALLRAVPKVLSLLAEADGILVPYLLTPTIRTGPGWRSQAVKFWAAWSRAMQRRRNGCLGLRCETAFSQLAGGIMAGESKLSASDGTLVHYHGHGVVLGPPGLAIWPPMTPEVESSRRWADEGFIFWAVQRWPDDVKGRACGPLADEWRACVGDPDANINLQAFRGVESARVGQSPWASVADCVADQLLEVFRYTLKHDGLSDADRWSSFIEFAHPRIQQRRAFGCMVGCDPSPEFVDDCSEFDGQPFIETCWRYLDGEYSLQGRRSALELEVALKRQRMVVR
jgi:hypothetical protein